MRQLTADAVTFYRREGYLLPGSRLFSSERHAELVSIFEGHLADKGAKLFDELDTPHFRDPRLLDFLLADEPLDLVEPLIGPDIALCGAPHAPRRWLRGLRCRRSGAQHVRPRDRRRRR